MCQFVSFLYHRGNLYFGADMRNHDSIHICPPAGESGNVYEGEWLENYHFPLIRLLGDMSDHYNDVIARDIVSQFPTRDVFILHGALQVLRGGNIPHIWAWRGWAENRRLRFLRKAIDHSTRFFPHYSRLTLESNAKILFDYTGVANPDWGLYEQRFNDVLFFCVQRAGQEGEHRWQIKEMRNSLLGHGLYGKEVCIRSTPPPLCK